MIFVTGASGNVGSALVGELARRQAPFRVGARLSDGDAVDGAEARHFDFLDRRTFAAAIEGCRALFLMRPPAIANTRATLNAFVDVARRSGVTQIVFLSVAGAGANPVVPHHAVERHLRAGPAGWTVLRPGFFAQNLGDAYRTDICADSRVNVPAGAGRVAFIDARDIADVAANALTEPEVHSGKAYTLTGSEALSFVDVATTLSRELGRAIRYKPASIAGYIGHLSRRGMPVSQIIVQTLLHVGLRFGQAQTVSDELPRLLGRRSRTLRDYVHDYRWLWLPVGNPMEERRHDRD